VSSFSKTFFILLKSLFRNSVFIRIFAILFILSISYCFWEFILIILFVKQKKKKIYFFF